MLDVRRLKARRNAARREFDSFKPLLDEALQYAIPFRRSTRDTGPGEKRVDQVFDHTAIDSAFRFAGRVQQDLWPAGQENFSLEPGPYVRERKEREALANALGGITSVLQAFFDDGDWDMAFHEMALDLSAGTGAMLLNPADDDQPDKLWDPISVPIEELLLESRHGNRLTGIFWTRKMSVRELFDTWPEGNFSRDLAELNRDKEDTEIDVHTDSVWDRKTRRWHMLVWCDKQDSIIHTSRSRTCPWLLPRYFRVPGETHGRGVVMLAMPTIKTTNTAARLQLQAAAIAMLGIYTAVDDGVFNPDQAPLEPGRFWKVARNQGSALGPSVARFPDPRLDLSNLVLNEMRMGIKATMMDQSLPPDAAAVRSATEILERVKRLASDHLGAYGRLIKEVVVPAVRRAMEIAYSKGLIEAEIPIDQLLVRVRVKSPLALAREAQRVQRIVQWLEMVLMLAAQLNNPALAARVAHLEQALSDIGRDLGVPEQYIVTEEEREQMDQQEAAAEAAMAVAAAAAGEEVAA